MNLTHYVSLQAFGGVERQFSQFLAHSHGRKNLQQAIVLRSDKLHPHYAQTLQLATRVRYEKLWHGVRLPRVLRAWHARRLDASLDTQVALLWNRMDQQRAVLDALGASRCLYWEHGSAWLPGGDTDKQYVANQLQGVLCNSVAAQRMLQLRWRYAGSSRVCLNGLSPLMRPETPQAKLFPADRPIRLGTASRLVPLKATVLAVQTLKLLRDSGVAVELHIAGDGPLRADLEALVARMELQAHVHFLGVVQDMASFYQTIDCLLHPVLREPFGIVCIEAGAHGCPVVATAVDGLPEVIEHGSTGFCVRPTLDASDLQRFGAEAATLPPYVYDPAEDTLVEPRLPAPDDLAQSIKSLFAEPAEFERISKTAAQRVPQRFDFEAHVTDVLNAVNEFARAGTL